MMTVTQYGLIQEALTKFGAEIVEIRESIMFAAPELQDFHWQRVADAGRDLVLEIANILTDRRPSHDTH